MRGIKSGKWQKLTAFARLDLCHSLALLFFHDLLNTPFWSLASCDEQNEE